MSKQLVVIGGPRYSGVTSIARRICELEPTYHFLDMKVCMAAYWSAASGDRAGFGAYLVETIQLLPDGVTVIDWGSFASRSGDKFEPVVSSNGFEEIINLPEVRQTAVFLLDVDARDLQSRRLAAPFLTCRSLPSDLATICKERQAERTTFREYAEVLNRSGSRINFFLQTGNVPFAAAGKRVVLWTKAFERATTGVAA